MASRRSARVDANQPEMVKELRKHGFHVAHTHTIGKGFPDVIVTGAARSGRVLVALVEIKQVGGKLTTDEIKWHMKYPKSGPLLIAFTANDVIEWFNEN